MRIAAQLSAFFVATGCGICAFAGSQAPRDWEGALDLRKAVTIKSERVAVNAAELEAAGVDAEAFIPPKRISGRSPAYPEAAARDGAQGTVLVDCAIGELGAVGACRVVQSVHPAVDRAAVKAVEGWKYEAARVNGQPRKVTVQFMMIFRLE